MCICQSQSPNLSLPSLELPFGADLCCNSGLFIPVYLECERFPPLWRCNLVQTFITSCLDYCNASYLGSCFYILLCMLILNMAGVILLKVRTCHSFTQSLMATHFPWSKTTVIVVASKPCRSCFMLPFHLLWPSLSSSLHSSHNDLHACLPTQPACLIFYFSRYPMFYSLTSMCSNYHPPSELFLHHSIYMVPPSPEFPLFLPFLIFSIALITSTILYHPFTLFCLLIGSPHPAPPSSPLDYTFHESRTFKKINRVYLLERF